MDYLSNVKSLRQEALAGIQYKNMKAPKAYATTKVGACTSFVIVNLCFVAFAEGAVWTATAEWEHRI